MLNTNIYFCKYKTGNIKKICLKQNYKDESTQTRGSNLINTRRVNSINSEYKRNNGSVGIRNGDKTVFKKESSRPSRNIYCATTTLEDEKILQPRVNNQASLKLKKSPNANINTCNSTSVKLECIPNQCKNSLKYHKRDSTNSFKSTREKSFIILIGIVLIFLTCNIPRIFVKLYIISSGGEGKDHFENCLKNNRLPVPAFILIMGK